MMKITAKQESDFLDAVISQGLLADSINWIQANLAPEEVFPMAELETWAEDNGYVIEE